MSGHRKKVEVVPPTRRFHVVDAGLIAALNRILSAPNGIEVVAGRDGLHQLVALPVAPGDAARVIVDAETLHWLASERERLLHRAWIPDPESGPNTCRLCFVLTARGRTAASLGRS